MMGINPDQINQSKQPFTPSDALFRIADQTLDTGFEAIDVANTALRRGDMHTFLGAAGLANKCLEVAVDYRDAGVVVGLSQIQTKPVIGGIA